MSAFPRNDIISLFFFFILFTAFPITWIALIISLFVCFLLQTGMWWSSPFILALGRQRQVSLSECKASLVRRLSSRTPRPTQSNPVSREKFCVREQWFRFVQWELWLLARWMNLWTYLCSSLGLFFLRRLMFSCFLSDTFNPWCLSQGTSSFYFRPMEP